METRRQKTIFLSYAVPFIQINTAYYKNSLTIWHIYIVSAIVYIDNILPWWKIRDDASITADDQPFLVGMRRSRNLSIQQGPSFFLFFFFYKGGGAFLDYIKGLTFCILQLYLHRNRQKIVSFYQSRGRRMGTDPPPHPTCGFALR